MVRSSGSIVTQPMGESHHLFQKFRRAPPFPHSPGLAREGHGLFSAPTDLLGGRGYAPRASLALLGECEGRGFSPLESPPLSALPRPRQDGPC